MDNECFTALHITVRDSYTSIIRGLLKHGSDANFGTSDEMVGSVGRTPLMTVAEIGIQSKEQGSPPSGGGRVQVLADGVPS